MNIHRLHMPKTAVFLCIKLALTFLISPMDEENSSIILAVRQHGLFQNLWDLSGPNFDKPSAEPQALEATLLVRSYQPRDLFLEKKKKTQKTKSQQLCMKNYKHSTREWHNAFHSFLTSVSDRRKLPILKQ